MSDMPIGETGGAGATADAAAATAGSRAHWLVFVGVAVAVIVLDQLTKAWLVANVSPGRGRRRSSATTCGSIFSQNSGALFGLFRDNAVVFGIVSLGGRRR